MKVWESEECFPEVESVLKYFCTNGGGVASFKFESKFVGRMAQVKEDYLGQVHNRLK